MSGVRVDGQRVPVAAPVTLLATEAAREILATADYRKARGHSAYHQALRGAFKILQSSGHPFNAEPFHGKLEQLLCRGIQVDDSGWPLQDENGNDLPPINHLHDGELNSIKATLMDEKHQLAENSSDGNANARIAIELALRHINAQRSIILGRAIPLQDYRIDHAGTIDALDFDFWTLFPQADDWPVAFTERVEYIRDNGGKIQFLGTDLDPKRAVAAYDIWTQANETYPLDNGAAYSQYERIYKAIYGNRGCVTYFEMSYLLSCDESVHGQIQFLADANGPSFASFSQTGAGRPTSFSERFAARMVEV